MKFSLFKRSVETNMEKTEESQKTPNVWMFLSIVLIAILVIGISGQVVLYQSDTNPEFCQTCHVMEPNVNSYLASGHLDNIHAQGGVQCKDCHDYPVSAEVSSGFNYVIGNYEVDGQGDLPKRTYNSDMCTDCHISLEHIAEKTAHLEGYNPHDSHYGSLECNTCHVSHGEPIDFCSQCHDNGDQRIIGAGQ